MGDNALSGLLPGGSASLFLYSEPQFNEKWLECELITAGLIQGIQPSRQSEDKRRAIIDYVERLIQKHFNCQISMYGSVPLKTYLPDGDIDLSTFSWLPHSTELWANELRHLLKREEHSKHAKFCVREVQIINAEVQIVKCLVDNVIVDISFNQLGGICTVCFLEEVDRLVGKDHLFKRSIILVKAWCYYESRILGAHHGLISTYALETLVLYIFNIFHASLRGPFEVLWKFLQFFSQFDWKHYCVSLWGPIRLTALHEMNAEPPIRNGSDLLFTTDFLSTCTHVYGFSAIGAQDLQGRNFSSKNMNVVDPLRFDNNLGRSVNRGNFFRICSAFAYGAKQIEKLLHGSPEAISENLDEFFRNTKKHCNENRPDAFTLPLAPVQIFATSGLPGNSESSGDENAGQFTDNWPGASQNVIGKPVNINSGSITERLKETGKSTLGLDVDTMRSKVNQGSTTNVTTTGNGCFKQPLCPPALPSVLEASDPATRRKKVNFSNSNGVPKPCINSLPAAIGMKNHHRGNIENARDLSSTADNGCNGHSHEGDCPADTVSHCSEATLQLMSCKADDCTSSSSANSPDLSILTGDFGAYLMSLHACRWMVASQFYAPITFTPSVMYTGRQMFDPFGCEGPGRPNGNINLLTQAFAYNYEQYLNPVFQGLSLQNASAMPSSRMFQDVQKSNRGTGTYLPNLRPGKYRDTQLVRGGRGGSNASKFFDSNGNANHDEANGFISRYSHVGEELQGSFGVNSQSDKRSILERNRLGNGFLIPEEKSMKFLPATSANAGGNTMKLTSQAAIYKPLNAAVASHREKEPHLEDLLTPSLQTGMLGSSSSNNSGFLTESLEFGSLGPSFLGKPKQTISHDSSRRDQGGLRSQNSHFLKSGDRIDSGEVTAKKMLFNDNQQSPFKCSYELKEEDFPPLSMGSQVIRSTPLTAKRDSTTEWPQFQTRVTDNSTWSSPTTSGECR